MESPHLPCYGDRCSDAIFFKCHRYGDRCSDATATGIAATTGRWYGIGAPNQFFSFLPRRKFVTICFGIGATLSINGIGSDAEHMPAEIDWGPDPLCI